jgi:hypothetical protein
VTPNTSNLSPGFPFRAVARRRLWLNTLLRACTSCMYSAPHPCMHEERAVCPAPDIEQKPCLAECEHALFANYNLVAAVANCVAAITSCSCSAALHCSCITLPMCARIPFRRRIPLHVLGARHCGPVKRVPRLALGPQETACSTCSGCFACQNGHACSTCSGCFACQNGHACSTCSG